MTSRKRSFKKKTSPRSSSGNPCTNEEIVPKEDFEVKQEEKEAYWDALCGSITPPPEVFYPTRPATQLDLTLLSRTSPAYLKTLREIYRVPSGVVFLVPVHGEKLSWRVDPELRARNGPQPRRLRKTSIDYSYRMAPKRLMSIIQGHTSNAKGCFMHFFLCSNRSHIRRGELSPLVPRKMELSSWYDGWKFATSIVPAIPRDLFAKSDLLRNGPFFWDSFPLDRIQNAVALYRSRGITRPLRASDMDEPHPDAVPDQRERVRPRKDKGIALEDRKFVSEDLPLPGWNPGFTPGDGSGTSEAPLPDDFFTNLLSDFTTPASLDKALRREVVAEGSWLINEGMRVFNSTFDGSFREARLSHFKAEEIERKFIRFQNEVAERERKQAESHSRALIRVERKGRRKIVAELKRRATFFYAEFRSFKDAQDYVGDFRECRGSVAEMSGLMDGCAQAESMVPPIEGRIRELWEPIEVLVGTTEAGDDAADEGGEVDQPADSEGRRDCFPFAFISRFI
uniref:Uncharacterized protein n=1 Tax=Brassica oleracea var. oleracea TaxID=109376 RepID=A0A0D3CJ20_BRAOL